MELTIEKIIQAFSALGNLIRERPEHLEVAVRQASAKNRWFDERAIWQALDGISSWLDEEKLKSWLKSYRFETLTDQYAGLVFAGNLPLVGFHDMLSVLCSGYKARIKLSSDDTVLNQYLIEQLVKIEKSLGDRIELVDRLQDFDVVIATGSNNSSRYFEYYFGKKPHIIRKNRNSIAVLNGDEPTGDLAGLGNDILDYYGMGCRSVSKIYIPQNYDLATFFEGIEVHESVKENFKYFNNYEFQKSILLINRVDHLDNGFLLLREESQVASPLAVLHYERYSDREKLEDQLTNIQDLLQCVVSNMKLNIPTPVVGFGESQRPSLSDYADQVDTLAFLSRQLSQT